MNEQPLIDSASEKILSLPAETQYAPNGIVSRTLLRTANSRTVLFGFAEGQELTEHTSTQHALIQILSGSCEFSLSGVPRTLKTGDLLVYAAQSPACGEGHEAILHAVNLVQASPDSRSRTTNSNRVGCPSLNSNQFRHDQ